MSILNIFRVIAGVCWFVSMCLYCHLSYKKRTVRRPSGLKHDPVPNRLSGGWYLVIEDGVAREYVEHYETDPDQIIRALQEAVNKQASRQ